MNPQVWLDRAIEIVGKIEGPYKWYVMVGVIIFVTGFLSRFIFRTIKWFLLLALVIATVVAVIILAVRFFDISL